MYFNIKDKLDENISDSYASASYDQLCLLMKQMIVSQYSGTDVDVNATFEANRIKFDLSEIVNRLSTQ